MDTSDSECFESADEELYPEDECKKLDKKCVEPNNAVNDDLKNLKVTDGSENTDKTVDKSHFDKNLNYCDDYVKKTGDDNSLINKESQKNVKENVDELVNKIVENDNQGIPKTKSNDLPNLPSIESSLIHSDTNKKRKSSLKDAEIKQIGDCIQSINKESNTAERNDDNMWDDDWEPKLDKDISKDNEINKNVVVEKSYEVLSKENVNKSINKECVEGNKSEDDENMWDNDWEPILDEETNDNSQSQQKPSTDKDNMWDNDDWEPFENIENAKSCPSESNKSEASWSGWGNWGVTSILSTATQGVSTLTNQVSQGLSTVLETSMGIPDPKELALQDKNEEKVVEELSPDTTKSNLGFGFGNLTNLVSGVSHITKFVETTGSKVITGGLDTLETIGKKTMEVLQEGDPGLKNKRALLKLDKQKPILSQVLREAKEKAERENKILEEVHSKKKLNYETLFDDYHGLVHLEALEMLSKQCDIKLQTLSENSSGKELQDLQETMDQIKELCELPDEEDDEAQNFEDIKNKINTAVKEMNVNITYDRLISIWEDTENWLNNVKLDFCDENELHQEALQVLAQLTAVAVEQFHKCGELLLIKEHRSTADEADSLVQLTMAITSLIGIVAAKFSEKLNSKLSQTQKKESINELITNVFFEAGNSNSYVQDAFQLLVPVLQVGAV